MPACIADIWGFEISSFLALEVRRNAREWQVSSPPRSDRSCTTFRLARGDPARAAATWTDDCGRIGELGILGTNAAESSIGGSLVGERVTTVRDPPGDCPVKARR
jgi:hypothetical protein